MRSILRVRFPIRNKNALTQINVFKANLEVDLGDVEGGVEIHIQVKIH